MISRFCRKSAFGGANSVVDAFKTDQGTQGSTTLLRRRAKSRSGDAAIKTLLPLFEEFLHGLAHAVADEEVGFGVAVPVIRLAR